MIYRKQFPKRAGYYWRWCADRRTTERIVLVSQEQIDKYQKSHWMITLHHCQDCRWAGPVMPPRPIMRGGNGGAGQ